MNKYGRQAQEAWKAASPARYSQIQNPEEFSGSKVRPDAAAGAERSEVFLRRRAEPARIGF